MKTRAAVCRDFEAPLVIEEIDLNDPGDGEVRGEACRLRNLPQRYSLHEGRLGRGAARRLRP